MPDISRRSMLVSGAAAATGLAAGLPGLPQAHAASRKSGNDTWGHTIPFGDEYHERMTEIVSNIRANEMALIAELTNRMATALRNGHNVWMQAQAGHMGYIEFNESNKGNPGILRSSTVWGGSDYDRMADGDVLMTNYISNEVQAARSRGVYVIGVPVCYVDNEWTPRGYITPNDNNWMLRDVSDVILQSYIPWTQGIVTCPEIPEMNICPSAANSLNTLYWMFQAEVAYKFRNPSATGSEQAGRVIGTVLDRTGSAWRAQRDGIFEAASVAAERIGNGAHYHVTSDHEGVQREATGVAMGPMMTNAFRREMASGDVHLLATIEPDSPAILEEAEKARSLDMFVVALGPSNSSGLRRQADVFIDNRSPEGGGLLDIPGYDARIGTAGGILNNWLMWCFTAQMVDEMVRRGKVPWFWLGYYMEGGREYDEAIRPFFMRQGF